jgi:hypothetical protein
MRYKHSDRAYIDPEALRRSLREHYEATGECQQWVSLACGLSLNAVPQLLFRARRYGSKAEKNTLVAIARHLYDDEREMKRWIRDAPPPREETT